METPTISKKEAKKTLSNKKKKAEVIKNILAKPYQNYWPILSAEDNSHLKEILTKFLPKIKPTKINVPYKQIQLIPKVDRRKFRESLQCEEVNNEARKNIIFGVNDVTQLLQNKEAAAILVASDVQPRFIVQHILDQAVLYDVPILVAHDLRKICQNNCGISGAVMAFKKAVASDSELGLIQQTIHNIHENYPVPDTHIHYHRNLDISTITISDSESEKIVYDSDEEVKEKQDCHLKRTTNGRRVFVPEKSNQTELSTFIELDNKINENGSQTTAKKSKFKTQYHPLVVKRIKGNKNRHKEKLNRIKKKF